LRDELETAKREFLRIVEENRDHSDVTRANKSGDGEDNDKVSLASREEIMELKNRAHLLTEENQVLFQQISVLRSHYDEFNKAHEAKTEDANKKI